MTIALRILSIYTYMKMSAIIKMKINMCHVLLIFKSCNALLIFYILALFFEKCMSSVLEASRCKALSYFFLINSHDIVRNENHNDILI